MTIRSMFTSEETIGSSGTERQQGITNVICELVEESQLDFDVNVTGVQGCGFYNDPENPYTMVQIVRLIQPAVDPEKGMGVVGICILTTQGCMIEASRDDVAALFYNAVHIYGIRSGDDAVVKHDNRAEPKKEDRS